MTLGRLLFAGVSAIFALVLVGVEAIYVRNAEHYLQQQLEAHAQETATSLALTLGATLGEPDSALAATIVNPVFDRGQFASIRLLTPDGRLLTERHLARQDYDTPAWFRGLFPIEKPRGEALVTSGWKQLGRIEVTLHPAFAYRQLWSVAGETAALLLALYLIALLATRRLLGAILEPLARVERAAIAISNREFVELPQESRTSELRRVVTAMNALSSKVRDAIAQDSARMQRYLREAYQDHVSGQLNYGGFVQRAKTLVHGENEVSAGTLALVALRGVEEMNRARGREVGDALLRALGEVLAREFEGRAPLVGRQDGAAFYAFVPELRVAEATRWMRGVMAEVHASQGMAAAGVVCFSEARPELDELEQWAFSALNQALQSGSDMVLLDFDPEKGAARPIAEWRATIEEALGAHRIAVVAQDVRALPETRVVHREIMLRVVERDGSPVPASSLLPAATRLGLLPRLDLEVLRRMAQLVVAGSDRRTVYALNVSGQSLVDPEYRATLKRLLAQHRMLGAQLAFEVTEYGCSLDPDAAFDFAREVRAAGAQFGIDDLELSATALTLARRLLPTYVKLASAYVHEMSTRGEARAVVESLVAMLRPLEVAVFAKGVEDAGLVQLLAAEGVAACQGYAIAPIEPLGG